MKTTANGTTAAQVNSNETKNAAAMVASNNQNKAAELPNLAPITDEIARALGFEIEHVAGDTRARAFYRLKDENGQPVKNEQGERLTVEITHCEDYGGPHSLPAMWYAKRWTPERLATWWSISTYIYDSADNCHGGYNPQHKLSDDRRRLVVNFDWMRPATAENFAALMAETVRRFMACR